MRIISGEFRSRRLHTPPDANITRPIPDRVKESVFSLLRGHFEGARVFDAFAGTGAIGLEALSRGAAHVVFVEKDKSIADVLRRNIEMLDVGNRAELVVGDALGPGALARAPRPLTLAFLDPPYPLVRDPLGFKRVMSQLSGLIDRLEPKSFAILRTPWPLFLEPGVAEIEEEPRRKGRKDDWRRQVRDAELGLPPEEIRKRSKKRTGRDIIAGPEDADELIDLDDPAVEGLEDGLLAGQTPHPPREKPDLTLPNALGPETHEYQSMAVHLYMRKT
ncbi:MAG: hypothetical protein GC200_05920 [Tepidisphaera sp.]|nr:hypothetical protein [Tepidisphaera sp.]